MESRLVLIIEGDDDIANPVAAAIREADYEVVVSSTAAAGLAAAIEIRPDCVLCDADLPDDDGYSLVRNLRAHSSPVSVTPFVMLSAYNDPQARLEAFHVGTDAYVTKPFRVEEVVAQVDALVHLAFRMRRHREATLSIPPEAQYGATAIEGDLRLMSVATVLSVLGMERRTGVFEVISKKRRAQVEIVTGYVVHGTVGGTRVTAIQALRLMLSWNVGRFSFMPLPPCDPPPDLLTVQAMLLDAAKAEDEAAAGMPPSRSWSDGAYVASYGGPPSRRDDTAPPSSRAMREAAAAPVSLAFDLISSRRAQDLHDIVASVVDRERLERERLAPLSERDRPAITPPTQKPPPLPSSAPPPPTKRPRPSATRSARELAAKQISKRAPVEPPPESAMSVELEELLSVTEASMSVSVSLDELEAELSGGSPMSIDDALRGGPERHRATPTPPSGMPVVPRKVPAIVPPPPSSISVELEPLPAPPPAPKPPPRPPRTVRAPHRAGPKK